MILEAEQSFVLTHPAGQQAALAFVRDPGVSLSRLAFLRNLRVIGQQLQGELMVTFPIIGEVTLPFCSRVSDTPGGAQLVPVALGGERAWVEVQGNAAADAGGQIQFEFVFRAHLALPDTEGWGGAAFEKMVRAAASRTLERVAATLPGGLSAAMLPPQLSPLQNVEKA